MIGECWKLDSNSWNRCVTGFKNTLSPTTYLNSLGSDRCAYSPPNWLLYPVNTYPFALSYLDANSYSKFLFHLKTSGVNSAS